jgi:hypothetical protein
VIIGEEDLTEGERIIGLLVARSRAAAGTVSAALLIVARGLAWTVDKPTALRKIRAAATPTRKDPVALDVQAALLDAAAAVEAGEHMR